MSDKKDSNQLLEKIQSFVKEHKKLLIVLSFVALLVYTFRASAPRRPVQKKPTASNENISSGKEKLVTALLEKTEDSKKENSLAPVAQTLVIEKKPSQSKKRPSAKKTLPRAISTVQKIRSIYSYDRALIRSATLEAKLVESSSREPVVKESTAPPTKVSTAGPEQYASKIGMIQPGSILRARLVTGMIAPEGETVKFVAKLLSVKGNVVPESIDFSSCFITGEASLNTLTNKVIAKATHLACPDKYVELQADAVSDDLTTGLVGKYYSRLPQRLAMAFFETLLPGYSEARAAAEEKNSANVSNYGSTTVVNSKIENPEKYAFWQAITSFGGALKEELSNIRHKQVPVAVIDPMTEALFFVTAPSKITFLVKS